MNKILVVSRAIIDEYVFSNIIKNKVEIIGNPINCNDIIKNLPQKVDKKYDICFVGRLAEQKDPLKFINIINEIKKEIPQIEVVMLGDGELKNECQRIIDELQLQNNIKLLGFKKNVYEYMAESKIFCLTSKFEGFGLVAFEALTLGLPCIVSNVGGLVDIVNNECGWLCSSDKEFRTEIIELLQNQEKYDKKSQNAKERATKIENSEGYYKKIYREYKDLGV
jgi:glycosyltransferase involved in cell wall biosynthesis